LEAKRKIEEKLFSIAPSLKFKDLNSLKIIIFPPKVGEWLPFREWPPEYFVELGRKILTAHPDALIILTGTKSASSVAERIVALMDEPERCINLTGKTTLKELIDLYNISTLVVGVDSGLLHFASLTNIKIVAIFGPDTPKAFAPLSENCVSLTSNFAYNPCFSAYNARTSNCKDPLKPCLLGVKPAQVYEINREMGVEKRSEDNQQFDNHPHL
jgi:ADP-heptose:LPS heptosyltransferase